MCPPNYFRIDYEINPWMHKENNVVSQSAFSQFNSLVEAYKKINIPISMIDADPELPDMVYSANYGFVQDNIFIASNFRYEQRRAESTLASKYFAKRNFEIARINPSIYYEGEGDHLKIGGVHYMGYGKRTSIKAAKELSSILNEEIIPLELVNPYFYHLDTALGPLNENTIIVNKNSFSPEGLSILNERFTDIIYTNEEDNRVMAPNLLAWGKDVVMAEGISSDLEEAVTERGFTVHKVLMTEFLKGGGSIKCLSLRIN